MLNGICLFRQLSGIWGVATIKILGTIKGITMNVLPEVGIHKKAWNLKKLPKLSGM